MLQIDADFPLEALDCGAWNYTSSCEVKGSTKRMEINYTGSGPKQCGG